MKKLKSHFRFNKQERSGIFFLLLFIILLQIGYFLWKSFSVDNQIDGFQVNSEMQDQIDVLKQKALRKDSIKIFPFNPNFITDHKGYTLGMSVEEIDRLHNFRSTRKYVNSPKEFQQVTQVSDSLLGAIAPYFKFPEWAQKGNMQLASGVRMKTSAITNVKPKEIVIRDLNSATAEDLKKINGIGEKLSARIVKFRDRLGGFLVEEQLFDVYGLESDVAEKTLKRFKLLTKPEIEKIDLNAATVDELAKLIYLRYRIAEEIVAYREANGRIKSFDELAQIEDFPANKIERIALYLSLK
mgnify:CR=1 FL=1